MRSALLLFFFTTWVSAQTNSWVVPWTSNRTDQWASRLLVNNTSGQDAVIDLTAVRPGGENETVTGVTVPASSQLILDVGDTFTTLGSGPGYAVFVSSTSGGLNVAVDVSALSTDSGDSPASGIANHGDQAAYRLLFPSMPWTAAGASAAVVVNPGDSDAALTMTAFSANGQSFGPVTRTVSAGQPLAELMAGLFPALEQTSYLMVDSDQPVLGMGFSFNGLGEPSMLNAVPVFRPETDRAALDASTGIAANLSLQADKVLDPILGPLAFGEFPEAGGTCPVVTVGPDPEQGDKILIKADWGTGCTNEEGEFFAGSVALRISADVIFGGPNAFSGELVISDFQTRNGEDGLYMNGTGTMDAVIDVSEQTVNANLSVVLQIPSLEIDTLTEMDLNLKTTSGDTSRSVTIDHVLRFEDAAMSALTLTSRADAPMVFNNTQCGHPFRGSIEMNLIQGTPVNATLDFATGNCDTATVIVDGVSQTINL